MPSDPPPQADYQEILRGLQAVHVPGTTFEVRALNGQRFKADNGYFRDPITAANAIIHSDNSGRVGIYATMNSVDPDCYARGADCITNQSGGSTNDKEIPSLQWLTIDIDPKRKSGISSTDSEKARAYAVAQRLMEELHFLYGWTPIPILCDSGNGYHLKYRIANLENTPENVALIKAILYKLAENYDTDGVSIDTTCFNPSRIIRLTGTVARKGSHMPSEGRPHRLSRLLQEHDQFAILSKNELLRVAAPVIGGMNGHSMPGSFQYPPDENLYRQLNRDALQQFHLDIWVPEILESYNPKRLASGVWRIDKQSLGRDLDEDISFHPDGVKDFGEEVGKTPVTVVAMLVTGGDKRAAAYLIAGALGLPATPFERMPIGPPDTPPEPMALPAPPGDPLPLPDATGGYTPAVLKFTNRHMNQAPDLPPPFVPQWFDGVTLLAGDPKAGKSFLALQSAICITLGWPFLGSPTKQCDTWYISLEDKEDYIHHRVLQILRSLCIEYGHEYSEELGQYVFDHMGIHCFNSDDDNQVLTLHTALPQFEQGLDLRPSVKYVVIDPFFLIKGEGKTNDVVMDEYRNLRLLMQPFTARLVNVTIVHHTNKGDHSPMNRISGTQAIKAAPETLHVLAKIRFGDVDTGMLQVDTEMRYHHVNSTNYLKRGESGYFYLGSKEDAFAPTESEIVTVTRFMEMNKGISQTAQQIAGGANIDKNRITSILSEMDERGIVENYSGRWSIVGAGGPRREGTGTQGKPNELMEPLKAILAAFLAGKADGVTKAKICREVHAQMEISQPSIDKYLPRLVLEGFLIKPEEGVYALKPQALPDWL